MSQNVEFYLHYVVLRKNHRLRVLILSELLRHRWNEMTFQKRYLYESLSNLIYNNHENRLLTMINFTKQNATNCTKFCEKLSRNFDEWVKRLMQRDQTVNDVLLKIISDNLTKKNLLKFDANWVDESMKMKNVCFAFSKVSKEFIESTLNMIIMMYVVYRCLQNDDETFEESEVEIRNDILKLYKDFASFLYFSIEFSAELFSFNQRFLATIKILIFFAIDDVIVNRRLWNFSTMRIKLN